MKKKKQRSLKKRTHQEQLNNKTSFFDNPLFILLFIVSLSILTYANSIDGTFHFDDIATIKDNPSIRGLSPLEIWKNNNHLRFIGFMSFALNYAINGLDNIRGWHYVNISLHILCTILFYIVLSLIMKLLKKEKSKVPLIAASLFSVHPLLSEPVNYIQARLVLFYSFFTLCGVICALLLLSNREKKTKILLTACMFLFFIFDSMSKEVGLFYFPASILLVFLSFWKDENGKNPLLKRKSIFLIILIASALFLLSYFLLPLERLLTPSYSPHIGKRTLFTNILTHCKIFFKYIMLMVPFFPPQCRSWNNRIKSQQFSRASLFITPPAAVIGIVYICMEKERQISSPVFPVLLGDNGNFSLYDSDGQVCGPFG